MNLMLVAILAIFGHTRADEVCCDAIGCFSDDYPYDHYPLPRCPDSLPTSYELFTRDNRDNGEEFDRNTIPTTYFDVSSRTVFILHGYMNDRNTEWLFDLKNTLLDGEDMNVIIVGWGGILDYPTAASTVRTVRTEAALVVNNLVSYGSSYGNMWCVGHSLGAHVCANVGMNTDGDIARVTGLDPAGPWFENYDHSTGINPSVANFVDILHTMCYSPIVNYGLVRAAGHMDFYPNGGDNLQPGCLTYYESQLSNQTGYDANPEAFMGDFDVACSHGRSILYFQESILTDCFIARQMCPDPYDIPDNCYDCNGGGECARMGFYAQGSGADGIYYLETDNEEPFCLN